MIVVSEADCRDRVDRPLAYKAVEACFVAMARGNARNFPVIRETLAPGDALYGVKSGYDEAGGALGLKSGGYWKTNAARGLINHQSVIMLFDPETGQPTAITGGNHITALRTAAAAAVSISHLARKDAKVLGIVGAGHQAPFQLRAAAEQRKFERVVGWNRSPERLGSLADAAAEMGLPFEAVTLDELGKQADVIITIVSSFAPVLLSAHVRPGTHIAAMGTDTKGKQELDAELVARGERFTDEHAQSVTIGEFQHAVASGLVDGDTITPLGEVITGNTPGRSSDDALTIYDGTGVGLQDLAVAKAVVAAADKSASATRVAI